MKELWKSAAPISCAAVILGLIWLVNGCMERGERFKTECMRAGGSVASTPSQDLCLQTGSTISKSKP